MKRGTLLRDRASAAVFWLPAMWRAEIMKSCSALKKKRVRNKRMSWGSLADPLFNANTTAMLSQ